MLRKPGFAVVLRASPYATAIPFMPLMQSDAVFVKKIMAVEGAIVGTVLACLYFRDVRADFLKEVMLLAIVWIAANWLLDFAALLPFTKMPLSWYFLEVGLRCIAIAAPTVAASFTLARHARVARPQAAA